jgi:hypothetical protein
MEDRKRVACGVPPRGCPEGRSQLRVKCLIEGSDPTVEVTVRVRQTVERQVLDARGAPVEYLIVAGRRYASRMEVVEHEIWIPSLPDRTACIEPAGARRGALVENGITAGALTWRWEPLHATIEAWIEEIAPGLGCVEVNVANRLEWTGAESERRLPMRAFYSTEVVMHSPDGAFASLTDPPAHLREHAAACHNEGLWPVPIGEAGDRRTMLASQIPLEDYPDVVPKTGPILPGPEIGAGRRMDRRSPPGLKSAERPRGTALR